jgi:hypothetical protein
MVIGNRTVRSDRDMGRPKGNNKTNRATETTRVDVVIDREWCGTAHGRIQRKGIHDPTKDVIRVSRAGLAQRKDMDGSGSQRLINSVTLESFHSHI